MQIDAKLKLIWRSIKSQAQHARRAIIRKVINEQFTNENACKHILAGEVGSIFEVAGRYVCESCKPK